MTVRPLIVAGVLWSTLPAAFGQTQAAQSPPAQSPPAQSQAAHPPGQTAASPQAQSAAASTGPLYYLQALSPAGIKIVQSKLHELGMYTGPADGNWNNDSATALQNFQSSHDLQTTGQINQATAMMLGIDPVALLPGSAGGPSTGASGEAPPASAAGASSGEAPPASAAGAPPAPPAPSASAEGRATSPAAQPPGPLARPSSSTPQTAAASPPSSPVPLSANDVRALQARLARAGAYKGRVDGVWGARSEAALLRFQQMQGLPLTGRIDAASVQALGFDPKHFASP